MAALMESRFVWSATLVIVVTTALMLSDFSRTTPSLTEIEAVESMSCCMVVSMPSSPSRPAAARAAAWSARELTSSIVPAKASLVAEISRTAAAIWVVALESPCTLPCCCLAVAAISAEVESNCTLPSRTRWTTDWILAIIALMPAASCASSSLLSISTRAVRSPGAAGHLPNAAEQVLGRMGDAPRRQSSRAVRWRSRPRHST